MCWCTVLLKNVKVKLSPQVRESDRLWVFFVAAMVKLQPFVSTEPDKVHHQSRVAIQQLIAPVARSKFVLAADYDVGIKS